MDDLLECRCGHGVSHHASGGCDGDRLRPCWCTRSRIDVIDAAVTSVRSEYPPLVPVPAAPAG